MAKSKNGSNFLVQGSILAFASIVSRIIGLIYRIPMTDIIGDLGNSYYGSAFEVYNIMLIISSYSLPLAVSKMVSAQMAAGHKKMAYQIFKCAMMFAFVSGTIVALIVFFGAQFFSDVYLKTPYSIFALRVLAPGLLVVAILGVIRGFFQGMGTMVPTAISQVIEQIVNAVVSIWAAYVLFNYGKRIGGVLGDPDHYAAAFGASGGTLGTNLGSVAALIFMCFVFAGYIHVFKRRMKKDNSSATETIWATLGGLIAVIFPVLLSTTIYNISGIIDNGIYKHICYAQGYAADDIDVWWGVYTGKYKLLINVPISIASAMAASSVPALTAAYQKKDMKDVRLKIKAATRFVMIIAIPSAVGLAVLGKPIIALLFRSTMASIEVSGKMMAYGSIAVVFYALSTLSNGLLQGIDRMKLPVRNAAISLVAHIIVLVVLMLGFKMNIYAVVYANVFFAFMMCFLNQMSLCRYSKYHHAWYKTFILPSACSAIMGLAAFAIYHGLYAVTSSNVIALLVAMFSAVVIYTVFMLLLKGLTEEELKRFPKGNSLIRFFRKLHLI